MLFEKSLLENFIMLNFVSPSRSNRVQKVSVSTAILLKNNLEKSGQSKDIFLNL
jgi:hypothetical protein